VIEGEKKTNIAQSLVSILDFGVAICFSVNVSFAVMVCSTDGLVFEVAHL